MPNYQITLSLDTIGTLDEGGLLEALMQDQLLKIVNESAGQDLDVQIFEARCLVALSDLLEALPSDRRKPARVMNCIRCGKETPHRKGYNLCPPCAAIEFPNTDHANKGGE